MTALTAGSGGELWETMAYFSGENQIPFMLKNETKRNFIIAGLLLTGSCLAASCLAKMLMCGKEATINTRLR